MNYAYIVNGKVYNIIPEEDPIFPGVPLAQRYAPEVVDNLVEIPDDVPVQEGWEYSRADNKFSAPVVDMSGSILKGD